MSADDLMEVMTHAFYLTVGYSIINTLIGYFFKPRIIVVDEEGNILHDE